MTKKEIDKLEVKHLSPYLTYKLKLYAGEFFVKNNLDVILDRLDMTTKAIDASNLNGVWFIDQIKPILRPLSDLTKEIEVNGKKFVPYDYFLNDTENDWFEGNIWMRYLFEGNIDKLEIGFIPYYVIQKLLQLHFDIFGLIEKGLAISYNDINNLK
jgi:hypothetical protein